MLLLFPAILVALLFLVHLLLLLDVILFLLQQELTIWSKDVGVVRRRDNKSSQLKRLLVTSTAAAALVGEGDHQAEDEAEDGAGDAAKDNVETWAAVPSLYCVKHWGDEYKGKDSDYA